MNPPHILGVILARAGSKGLPRKNVLPIASRPMIAWTIDAARAATRLNALCVTTDLAEAAAIARSSGLPVVDRPAELADDAATVDSAARHAVVEYERLFQTVTHVVLLYANIPVRPNGIIDAAIDKLIATGADSVRSLAPVDKMHPDWMHRLDGDRIIQYRANSIYRRQDLEPLYFHDGAVVAVTRASLFNVDPTDPHAFFGRDRRGVVSPSPAVDVDSATDARVAEAVLRTQAETPKATGESMARLVDGAAPYVIAEIGVNHDGSIEKARALIDAAKYAGANAIKLQIFSADSLASEDAATCRYQQKNTQSADSQRDMLRRLELPRDALLKLRAHTRDVAIDFIATPFGIPELEFLAAELDPGAVKIASPDLVNIPLLRAAANTGKRIIVSTGASEWEEIVAAVELLHELRNDGRLALLHCVSAYPTPAAQIQLAVIRRMIDQFRLPVGFSDHTMEIETGAYAVLAGASILEKHITLDRKAPGPDHAASLEPARFADYVRQARQAAIMLGRSERTCLDIERDVRSLARGRLVARRTIMKGATITADALMVQRPGDGIPPTELGRVVGRTAARRIDGACPLAWDMLTPAG
ncbi:MAG: N-acetylneuraminate synthase family protein [Phycisphaerales bacterium]|nr:N-acetylneuraminate synthase family protein [Phycisphaerales bacterium]MCB9857511.1 N-acetylneuraminate synthase family protein [Phycisphaerales bacterium]MCB9864504.1 N-acetylneuraminate synthase family protein [Phycisphaerales bacterium]